MKTISDEQLQDLILTSKRLQAVKKEIENLVSKKGVDKCWYFPDVFRKIANILDIKMDDRDIVINHADFALGCKRYQNEIFNIQDCSVGDKKFEEVASLPNGCALFRKPDSVGGWHYASDEVGGGVTVWISSLVSEGTLLAAIVDSKKIEYDHYIAKLKKKGS